MSENSPSCIRFGVRWCLPSMFIYHLNNSTKFETAALYYDKYGRVVQSRASNHLGGYDLVYNALDFTGKPLKTYKTHGINGTTPNITELYGYTYDKAQRLTATTYSLNGGSSVILASNAYDELGRLITKKRHTSADTETYAYNIRNWLTNINSGGFTESLYYNTNPLSSNVCFNGNISYSNWTYNNAAKGYLYGYDDLNRLLSASFKQGSSGLGDDSFNENFTYDKMGNILTLKRKKDNTLIDDLVLHYSNNEKSNQLQYVDDGGATQGQYLIKEYQNKSNTQAEFAYDSNGNMIKDLDRDIYTIQYNVLNLPDVVQFKNGNQIKNTYNAGGQKLGTEYFTWVPGTNAPVVNTGDVLNISYSQGAIDQNGTVYIGNVEYKTQNGNSSLTAISRIHNAEGYVENLSSPQYYYYRKDHLGNNREVWLANTNSTVQRTQYYPSGLPWVTTLNDNQSTQPYKYNGKEFVEMHGYDMYDYGWRGYYAAGNVIPTVDPLAEKYYSLSPYAYCAGNPVKFIDPSGMSLTDFEDGNGDLVKHVDDGSSAVFQQTGKGTDLHYEFKGYNKNSSDPKVVNLTSAVQEQQQLNMENPALQQNAEGYNETHCNQATRDVMKTVDSALESKTSIVVNGRANDMAKTLSSGKNENYLKVNESEATKNAQTGGLSLVTYMNPNPNKSGHIATFSVGTNLVDGKIANIGTAQYTGFVSLNGAINKNKSKEYFILLTNVLPTVTAVGQKK